MQKEEILASFQSRFGTPEITLNVPGRANIIGEHTDYNDGLVLPFAIDRYIYFIARKNLSSTHNIHAVDIDETVNLSRETEITEGWQRFFSSVIISVDKDLPGLDISFGGNLPLGAGLSSSSAIVCGFIYLINSLNDFKWSIEEMSSMAFSIESGTGVDGGMMDQTAILQAQSGHAIFLDCQNKKQEQIKLDLGKHKFYLINTGVTHNLIETRYNERRRECKNIIKTLNQVGALYESLRDLDMEDVPDLRHILTPEHFKRASFVIKENIRVTKAVTAIKNHDFGLLGSLMYDTHKGLRYDYEVSCAELNYLVDLTKTKEEVLGSRMMGGGFGGCTLNLLEGVMSDDLSTQIIENYQNNFGVKPEIIAIQAVDGIHTDIL